MWATIYCYSCKKDGEYGAPKGMLFMQEKAEFEER